LVGQLEPQLGGRRVGAASARRLAAGANPINLSRNPRRRRLHAAWLQVNTWFGPPGACRWCQSTMSWPSRIRSPDRRSPAHARIRGVAPPRTCRIMFELEPGEGLFFPSYFLGASLLETGGDRRASNRRAHEGHRWPGGPLDTHGARARSRSGVSRRAPFGSGGSARPQLRSTPSVQTKLQKQENNVKEPVQCRLQKTKES
jgi:hypothetical protein